MVKLPMSMMLLNRLVKVTDALGNETMYTYDSVGNRKSIINANDTITEYEYDKLNRLVGLVNKNISGDILSSYKYELGAAGNRTKVTENDGRVVEYVYDDLYRLVTETIKEPDSDSRVIYYEYDKVGNRLSKKDNDVTTLYVYDDNDRLTEDGEYKYTYDKNGNLIEKTGDIDSKKYVYDYQNRLISAITLKDGDTTEKNRVLL